MQILIIAILLSFLVLLIIKSLINRHKNSSILSVKLPPGPYSLPIIGDLHRLGRSPHRSLQKMSQQYGDIIYLKAGQVPTFVFSSRELAEKVTKTHDLDFCSRPQRVALKKLSYNFLDVAATPYGDSWRHMRRLIVAKLLSTKRVDMGRSIRKENVSKMVALITELAVGSPRQGINLTNIISCLVQDVKSEMIIGKGWTSDVSEKPKIIAAVLECNLMGGSFFVADYLPWARWFDILNNKKLDQCFSTMDKYIDKIIEKRLADRLGKEELKEDEEDFVDLFLRLEKSCFLTRNHLKANCLILFLAAIDSTFATLTWAMCELIRNKRVMATAQEEIRRVCGNKGKVEESDTEKLVYLKTVVKETLRLHIPTPLVPRESMRQTEINGYDIPEKSLILINTFSITRDPRYWKNPLEFIPERFLDSTIDYRGQHYEFLPFGAGRRICPGMQYGETIVELALANLLYTFDWELPIGTAIEDLDMSEKPGITLTKKTPLFLVPKYSHSLP